MKLKNVLFAAFIILTIIPVLIVSCLLYQSGFQLSKESHLRNLMESIHVQADYISQTVESDMLTERRFAERIFASAYTSADMKSSLLSEIDAYLEGSEDQTAACLFLDRDNQALYTIGEKAVLDNVRDQMPNPKERHDQSILEFSLGNGAYTLGIQTPVWDREGNYKGSLISVYDKAYLFKIISSYYEIADTSTFICRENGEVTNFRGISSQGSDDAIKQALGTHNFDREGALDLRLDTSTVSGYYKVIHNSPWYLVGLIDPAQILAFTNQFIWVYLLIIAVLALIALSLSMQFSRRLVEPINQLIQVIDGYPESLEDTNFPNPKMKTCFEIRYLQSKFLNLMRTVALVQHNFKGIYKLYQSNTMDDTNIDIDVKAQTIQSNKPAFSALMDSLQLPPGACVVERFAGCFADQDQAHLMNMFETMRDKHLAVTREAEVFTPHLDQKWFHTLVVPMYEDDRLCRLFIQLRDISSFKRQEFESLEQVKREPLTGLYNRTGFFEHANSLLRESDPSIQHGLLFLDMNDFKLVNDSFGHSVGDELLRKVARTLKESLSTSSVVARIGGDEFVAFLPDISEQALLALADQLQQRLCFPYETENGSFQVTASIGQALSTPGSPQTLDALLHEADEAMYRIKRKMKLDKKV